MSKVEYLVIALVVIVVLWIGYLFATAGEESPDNVTTEEIKSIPITNDNPDVAVPIENDSTVGSASFGPRGGGVSLGSGVQMDLDGGGLSIGGF